MRGRSREGRREIRGLIGSTILPVSHVVMDDYILPLDGSVVDLISNNDEVCAICKPSSPDSYSTTNVAGAAMASGTESWNQERFVHRNRQWQRDVSRFIVGEGVTSFALVERELISSLVLSSEYDVLCDVAKFYGRSAAIDSLGAAVCIRGLESLVDKFSTGGNEDDVEVKGGSGDRDPHLRCCREVLSSLRSIVDIGSVVAGWDGIMRIIGAFIHEEALKGDCVDLLRVVRGGDSANDGGNTNFDRSNYMDDDDLVPVDCILPLLVKTSDPSTLLVGAKLLLQTAEASFYPRRSDSPRHRNGTVRINFITDIQAADVLRFLSEIAHSIISDRKERSKRFERERRGIVRRKKFRRRENEYDCNEEEGDDLSDISVSSASSDGETDSDEEAEAEKAIIIQWHEELQPDFQHEDSFLFYYAMFLSILCVESGGGGLGRKLCKDEDDLVHRNLIDMASMGKVFGERADDVLLLGGKRRRDDGDGDWNNDDGVDSLDDLQRRVSIISSIRSSASSTIASLSRLTKSKQIYNSPSYNLVACLKLIGGGCNLGVCIGCWRLRYMLRFILSDDGVEEEEEEEEEVEEGESEGEGEGEEKEEPRKRDSRHRKKNRLSKERLAVIVKALLKSALSSGSRGRLAALEVIASTVSLTMRGRECLMEYGGSRLIVEILSVAIEGSSGEEKLLNEEVRRHDMMMLRQSQESERLRRNSTNLIERFPRRDCCE